MKKEGEFFFFFRWRDRRQFKLEQTRFLFFTCVANQQSSSARSAAASRAASSLLPSTMSSGLRGAGEEESEAEGRMEPRRGACREDVEGFAVGITKGTETEEGTGSRLLLPRGAPAVTVTMRPRGAAPALASGRAGAARRASIADEGEEWRGERSFDAEEKNERKLEEKNSSSLFLSFSLFFF